MKLDSKTPIQPFKIPRRPSRTFRGQPVMRRGKCYVYALKEVVFEWPGTGPAPRLIHGQVWQDELEMLIDHAWVERGGFAYDWQMFATRPKGAPVPDPVPVDEYHRNRQARVMAIYTKEQAVARAVAERHFGPWEALKGATPGSTRP